MKLLLTTAALATLITVGCASCQPSPISPPDDVVDGAVTDTGRSDGDGSDAGEVLLDPCERACRHLADLHCAEAESTDEGGTCVEICTNMEDSGVLSFNPECVAKVAQCIEVDSCVLHDLP